MAFVTGAPNAATTGAVLSANAKIAAAFGAAPVFFGVGELGGGYSNGGTHRQTVTSSFDMSVDLTKLAARDDLVVGLYNGKVVGGGFTSLSFDVYADGTDVVHRVFNSAAAAKTFFTNHAIDLGSLASGQPLGADTLSLHVVVSITTDTPGSRFYGDMILGDPPRAAASPTTATSATLEDRFVAAMASFGAGSGGSPPMAPQTWRTGHPMLAVHTRAHSA